MTRLELAPDMQRQITGRQKDRLKALEEWDLRSISARTARRLGWSDEWIRLVEAEYKKFLALSILRPNETYGMSGPVDELWHDHICDTMDYIHMCSVISDGMIHHCPTSDGDASAMKSYENTLSGLNAAFKHGKNELWPKEGRSACRSCVSCKAVIGNEKRTINY
jgi:hypothetical protein